MSHKAHERKMQSQIFMHTVRKMFGNAIDKNACFDYNNNRDGKE